MNMLRKRRQKADGQEIPVAIVRRGTRRLVLLETQHQLSVQGRTGICWVKPVSLEQPFP